MPESKVSQDRLAVMQYMAEKHEMMLAKTEQLANINSGSYNNDGIQSVQEAFHHLFSPLSETAETIQLSPLELVDDQGSINQFPTRPMQVFKARPDAPLQILMTGHSDTVFPKELSFQSCWVEGNLLRGPGTADMKGGFVVLAAALEYLNQSEFKNDFGFTVAISPDEEIGSIASAPVLMDLAKQAHYGMTYEPALSDGTLAGARKGSGNFTLTAKGFSTHAGREFFEGRNAVLAIAMAAHKFSQVTDKEKGITLNIGKISGGGAVNIVPDNCVCRFNVRVHETEHMALVQDHLDKVIQEVEQATGCELKLHGHFNRPPKPMTEKQLEMFELLRACGKDLGIDIQWKATGGCCEGNNLAAAGLLNIDTLGVRGANIHTDQEYACIDSFPERAALSVTLIEKLIQLNKQENEKC